MVFKSFKVVTFDQVVFDEGENDGGKRTTLII
jgi:hypothetical protein